MAPASDGPALVTGAIGFTGGHLAPLLQAAGYRVHPLKSDLTDRRAVLDEVASVGPGCVVHLAAISFVPHADVGEMYRVNVDGTRHLLEACAALAEPPRKLVLASSANVYGVPRGEPVDESAPAAPVNDYGRSKLAMEELARAFFDRLPIVLVRPFNYTGRGQAVHFVVPKLVEAFRARAAELDLGDTSVVRDFSDVRDVAEIYRRLLEAPVRGETVNICSGRAIALAEVIDTLAALSGHRPGVRRSAGLLRAAEIPRLVGSRARLERIVGPPPVRPFAETLQWMLRA